MSKLQEFLSDYDNAATRSGYQSAMYGFIKYVYNVKPSAGKNLRRTTMAWTSRIHNLPTECEFKTIEKRKTRRKDYFEK